jgi:hypothetical protein
MYRKLEEFLCVAEWAELERQAVFHRTWMLVAESTDQ